MHRFSFSHLDKAGLRRELAAANGNERTATATTIAVIAERRPRTASPCPREPRSKTGFAPRCASWPLGADS